MKQAVLIFACFFLVLSINAQDTFSIVAVDSVTGEVGSAGATCLQAPNPSQGALIISDVIPGLGAAHTQAQWNAFNQSNVHDLMTLHYNPQEILYQANIADWDGDSTIRQYGIAMFDTLGHVQTGAFTGINCMDYKNHILGAYYSIQGNILLGQQILDSIHAGFLNTSGSLADRLMAALQGANVPGADSRCLAEGVPAQSAFLRVAKPTDADTALYLQLVVKSRPAGMSPIDSLQTLFDTWKATLPSGISDEQQETVKIFPNPARTFFQVQFDAGGEKTVELYDMLGKLVEAQHGVHTFRFAVRDKPRGIYFLRFDNVTRKLVLY